MRRAVLLGFLLSTLACPPGDASSNAARDSAGIRITENTGPAWGAAEGWTVDTVPLATIGTGRTEQPYLLSRVVGALRLSDGRIVVLDFSSRELRFFDAVGTHLVSKAGRGQGPGEFQNPSVLARYRGDSLLVFELGRTVSVLDSRGAFGRRFQVSSTPRAPTEWWTAGDTPSLVGTLGTGELVFAMPEAVKLGPGSWPRPSEVLVFRSTADGSRTHTIAVLGSRAYHQSPQASGASPAASPFGSSIRVAARDSLIHATRPNAFEVASYRSNGTPAIFARRAVTAQPLTPAMIARQEASLRQQLGSRPDADALVRRMLHDAPAPERLDGYTQLSVDVAGFVWVRPNDAADITGLGPAEPRHTIFDATGKLLGEIRIPRSVRILDVGTDYILLLVRDADGVNAVRLHDLKGRR